MSEPTRPYANSLTFTTFFAATFLDGAGCFLFIKLNIMLRLELDATLLTGATKLATTAYDFHSVKFHQGVDEERLSDLLKRAEMS